MYISPVLNSKKSIIVAIINVVDLDYCWDNESRNVQDPEMEFSIIDLRAGKGDQSDWDGRFVLGQCF